MGLKAQKTKPVSGAKALIGKTAETLDTLNVSGQVLLMGETWNAVSLSGRISKNEKVIVKEIKGLTLYVSSENESA
jgi:membrane-bound serine protease (ClpP class)